MSIQYAVMHKAYPDVAHRRFRSRTECEEWILEAVEDGFMSDAFYLAHRTVTAWQAVTETACTAGQMPLWEGEPEKAPGRPLDGPQSGLEDE